KLTACLLSMQSTARTASYTLSLHDALPISVRDSDTFPARQVVATVSDSRRVSDTSPARQGIPRLRCPTPAQRGTVPQPRPARQRSEEHTSELQSRENLVCRLLLEKKKNEPR